MLFGNAKSKYLGYDSWNKGGLDHITNNEANCIILDTNGEKGIDVYVTNEMFARNLQQYPLYSKKYEGWYVGCINDGQNI